MWGRTAGQGLGAGLRGYPILALNAEDSQNPDSEAQPSPGRFLRGAGSSEAAAGVGAHVGSSAQFRLVGEEVPRSIRYVGLICSLARPLQMLGAALSSDCQSLRFGPCHSRSEGAPGSPGILRLNTAGTSFSFADPPLRLLTALAHPTRSKGGAPINRVQDCSAHFYKAVPPKGKRRCFPPTRP